MTDLRDQLARLFDDEPEAPYDLERIVHAGRRARRRRNAVLTVAGTAGAAGVAAAVVIPAVAAGGDGGSVSVGTKPPSAAPSASPTAAPGKCFVLAAPHKGVKQAIDRLIRSGKVGAHPTITPVKSGKHGARIVLSVCTEGTTLEDLRAQDEQAAPEPTGPPYTYTEEPEAVAARLGAHLNDRVSGFGLDITFTRPFSQETSKLERGRPSYFGGNVDVHEASGYADIGVQVTHEVTELVPFTGECSAAKKCAERTLPDGSILRTGEVQAGRDDFLLTAELHRPDGVVVQAQESNYPFGPDAGSQPHGDQPLTLDELVALAKDAAFTF